MSTFTLRSDQLDGRPSLQAVPASVGRVAGFKLDYHDDPGQLADAWRALEVNGVASLFQSYRWVSAWCRHAARPRGERPLIVVASDDTGRIAFIWPMSVVRHAGISVLGWLGQSVASYNLGLYRRDVMETLSGEQVRELLQGIAGHRPEISAVGLINQPAQWDGIANPFGRLPREPANVRSFELPLTPDFDALYQTKFSGRTRSTLRRKERNLAKLGALETTVADSIERRLEFYQLFKEQKARQFAEQGIPNYLTDPGIDAFYRELTRGGESGAIMEHAGLRVGDEVAATLCGVRFKDRFYFIQTSMTQGPLRKHSPGALLLRDQIARHCRLGAAIFDLGPGEGSHKDAWAGDEIPLMATYLPLSAKGWAATALRKAGARATRVIKQSPTLLRTARRMRKLARTGKPDAPGLGPSAPG